MTQSTEQTMHEYVVQQLQSSKGEWPQIASATSMAYTTLKKIATREVRDPGVSLVERLNKYFRERERVAA